MNRLGVLFLALVLLVTLTPLAHAQELQVKVVSLSWMVRPGEDATITIRTDPGAACQIDVRYDSGPSEASALRPKTADAQGMVSWTWQVNTRIISGRWPINVTCSARGQRGTVEATMMTRVNGDEGPDCGGA